MLHKASRSAVDTMPAAPPPPFPCAFSTAPIAHQAALETSAQHSTQLFAGGVHLGLYAATSWQPDCPSATTFLLPHASVLSWACCVM